MMRLIMEKYKKFKWRVKNKNNSTRMNNIFDPTLVSVGNYTYGQLTIQNHSEKQYFCRIGHFCSIADNVTFLVADEHNIRTVSTYPFKVKIQGEAKEAISKGDIIVDDDVWIGQGAIILSGVHICQGAIVAAGAVVNKDVPAYAVVGGVPAKVIKYRFDSEIIEELLKIDFSKMTDDYILNNIDNLYTEITDKSQLKDIFRNKTILKTSIDK